VPPAQHENACRCAGKPTRNFNAAQKILALKGMRRLWTLAPNDRGMNSSTGLGEQALGVKKGALLEGPQGPARTGPARF